jgi:thiamine-phosphate pyrophosphorylase
VRWRGLYAITPEWSDSSRIFAAVEAVLRGGAAAVQLRRKTVVAERRLLEAHEVARLCREANVPFIVNDDAVLAKTVRADGVHLGRDDGDLVTARELLGAHCLIGLSCYSDGARVRAAARAGADYVGVGSMFPSTTKPHALTAPLSLLRDAGAASIPVVAIGGITLENAAEVKAAGADMVAVISALFEAADPESTARDFTNLWESNDVQAK